MAVRISRAIARGDPTRRLQAELDVLDVALRVEVIPYRSLVQALHEYQCLRDRGTHTLSTVLDNGNPRWEYRLLWRYGPIGLVAVGAALLAIGLSGLCATAVSVTVLPIGLVCLLAGVVLPRIEGSFTAGPQGISATLLAAHKIDAIYSVTGPAVEAPRDVELAPGARSEPVLLGDVWDALEARLGVPGGFRVLGPASGTMYLQAPDGRELGLTNRGFADRRRASSELLELLASWGVTPHPSGKYGSALPFAGLSADVRLIAPGDTSKTQN